MRLGQRRSGSSDRRVIGSGSRRAWLRGFAWALVMLLIPGGLAPGPASAQAGPDRATTPSLRSIRIDGPITRVTADYVDRAVSLAESEGASAFLVELDTPGGSVDAMLAIGGRLLNAELPTLAWVGPQGAQAASAGTFLVLAADLASMAPRTTIGAASPVGPGGEDLPETIGRKLTEDMSATARNYAAPRGPKAVAWAELAVREAASATAEEALELGVIDVVADRPQDFLAAVEGREVDLASGSVRLRLEGARIEPIEPTAAEGLLTLLASPALALILMTLGVNAILAEFSNPGGGVAGLVGVLALALGLYGLGSLEANWLGLGFIAGAFLLFALEIKTPSMGFLTLGGATLFVVGAVLLFAGGGYAIPWGTILMLAAATAAFFLFVVRAAIRAMRRQPSTGAEALIGARGRLKRLPAEGRPGTVLVAGERWDAVWAEPEAQGAGPLVDAQGLPAGPAPGSPVTILAREGYTLIIVPA